MCAIDLLHFEVWLYNCVNNCFHYVVIVGLSGAVVWSVPGLTEAGHRRTGVAGALPPGLRTRTHRKQPQLRRTYSQLLDPNHIFCMF